MDCLTWDKIIVHLPNYQALGDFAIRGINCYWAEREIIQNQKREKLLKKNVEKIWKLKKMSYLCIAFEK
jgi:hypothetical protein